METESTPQTIFRIIKNKKHPYVMIDRTALADKTLSWKAKGILSYLLSLPDNWQLYLSELQNHSTNGRDSLYSGIRELMKSNYIKRKKLRNNKGQMQGYEYIVYERPYTEKPYAVKPYKENPSLLSNDSNNNNKTLGTKKRAKLVSLEDSSFNGRAAKKLTSIILKNNKMSRKVSVKRWAQEIRLLRTGQEIEKPRIVKVIKWLAVYVNDEFTPKLYKAVDFREKFTRIEDAMSRSNKKVENGEQKIIYTVKRRKAK